MDEREKYAIEALVQMVDQYMGCGNDLLDSSSMSAGEKAIKALAAFELVEVVNTRFGRWTPEGKALLDEFRAPSV